MKQSPASTERVREEWSRRIEAEYRSAALTQQLAHWLVVIAAPEELVTDAMRIVRDELAHARVSDRVARAAGAQEPAVIDRDSLALARAAGEPLEHDVARACLSIYCLGETLAVRLFAEMRRGTTVPSARRALDRILRDEVRHRDFGWTLLDALLEAPFGSAIRALVSRELPAALAGLRGSYAPEGAAREASPAERAWGLVPDARYREVLERTVERDFLPRLARRGFAAP